MKVITNVTSGSGPDGLGEIDEEQPLKRPSLWDEDESTEAGEDEPLHSLDLWGDV